MAASGSHLLEQWSLQHPYHCGPSKVWVLVLIHLKLCHRGCLLIRHTHSVFHLVFWFRVLLQRFRWVLFPATVELVCWWRQRLGVGWQDAEDGGEGRRRLTWFLSCWNYVFILGVTIPTKAAKKCVVPVGKASAMHGRKAKLMLKKSKSWPTSQQNKCPLKLYWKGELTNFIIWLPSR